MHLVHQVLVVLQELLKDRVLAVRVDLLKRKPFLKVILPLTHRDSYPQQSQYFRFPDVAVHRSRY